MKILLLCEAYDGGVKTYIDSIILNKKYFTDCEFMVMVSSRRLGNKDLINNKYIINDNLSFGKSPFKFIKALIEINKIVNKYKIKIIHANSSISGLLVFIYSFFNLNIKYIYTPHGYYSLKRMNAFKKMIIRFVERKINQRSRIVIHVSKGEENEAIKNNIITQKKSVIIYNGVDDPCVINRKHNSDIFTIVNLARVDDQKNPFEFLKIAKQVIKKNHKVKFIWAGKGMYLNEIRSYINENGYEKNIKFIGFQPNNGVLLKNADIYLSTSNYEGLPFSAIEAMSFKIPLVLSKVVGNSDLVNNEINGFLYELGNIDEATNIIEELINNREELNRFSEKSYKLFLKKFHKKKMIESLRKIYLELR